ncbi:hypothetical protein N0V90_000022 [Kalmusia sp. IMI 367209]|nr:hypothetical protein N0V90_000022 [Kalmusia sp. IMI 367209]
MNFGDAWKNYLGECTKETAFEMLDYFYSQGGNFIDTAVNYQTGESEQWLGEWMEARGRRDELIIATKFTGTQYAQLGDKLIQSNFSGNGSKNMHTSVKRSLKNLRTDYIDLYYVHLYDHTTSIPELMHTLNTLITSRTVLYLGISDTPAWLVVKCNEYARQNGLRPFSVYQGRWGAGCRDLEREIIPMCIAEGMAIAPWGVLGGGGFKKEEDREKEGKRSIQVGDKSRDAKVRSVLEGVADKKGTGPTSVALAYVMHKAPYVFPIVGGRKVGYLTDNIEALKLKLDEEDMATIDAAYGFEIGFPHDFLSGGNKMVLGPEDNTFNGRGGYFDFVSGPKPIPPHEGPLDSTVTKFAIGQSKKEEK